MSALEEFLRSDKGALAQYRRRWRDRLRLFIDDIEPQSKKMPAGERDRFQAAVAEQMTDAKRGPFTGPLALKLNLATTSRNAPQGHTIAKNLLDLLGKRRLGVNWSRNHLLYKDDAQIQALSVSCAHGQNHPSIRLSARPFRAMLDDIELATHAVHTDQMNSGDAWYQQEREGEWIDTLRELKQDEAAKRQRLGDNLYDAYFKMVRWSAQRALLGRSGVNIPVLSWMYGLPKGMPTGFPADEWARLVGGSKLRLQVGELPIAKGGSDVFKQSVKDEISLFKRRWDWVIDPLVIAVALEVVVRPNPATPPAVLHDLDNIVRDYLLPGIIPSFGTVSDHRWTIDFEELCRTDPDLSARWVSNPTPPPGTKRGVTRYEVWRLPPVAGEPGFVSVALVADMDANGGTIDQIDRYNRDWADQMGGATRW